MIPFDRKIAVIGLGYVGLPVAMAFSRLGKVIGFDINDDRIASLKMVWMKHLRWQVKYYVLNPLSLPVLLNHLSRPIFT